jgi:MoxR-like ATPase
MGQGFRTGIKTAAEQTVLFYERSNSPITTQVFFGALIKAGGLTRQTSLNLVSLPNPVIIFLTGNSDPFNGTFQQCYLP